MRTSPLVLLALSALSAAGACRGSESAEPPVHLVLNMDQQNRFEAQEENPFFADGRAMRTWPEGTVPFGALHDDDHLWRGRDGAGFASTLPGKDADGREMKLDRDFLARGKARYEIYCVPCHDAAGTGKGIVVERGMMQPPSFHDDRIRAMAVGQLYDVVTNGARNMPAYRGQIGLRDRWAIASYVRALQRSRNASLEDVPEDEAGSNRWEVR